MRLVLVIVVLAACHDHAPPPAKITGAPEDLVAYLTTVAGADEVTRRREVATWILDDATWRTTVVPTYAPLYTDYARGYDAAAERLVARLATRGDLTARRHYAGDPKLTRAQGRLRWALPVQYPSMVAELDGAPIDTVFVFDGARWRVLAGLDELVVARVRALDPACADNLLRAGPIGECTAIGWQLADTALRSDLERFAHACALAKTLCANSSP